MSRLAVEAVAIVGGSFLLAIVFIVGATAGRPPVSMPAAQPTRTAAPVAVATAMPTVAPTTPPPTSEPEPTTTPAPIAVEPTVAPAKPEPTLNRAAAARATSQAAPKPEPKPTEAPLAVLFTGRFEPVTLRVGQKLVVELTLENKSEQQIEGVRIFSSGPWDKYTIVNVMPNGRHESGMLGHNFTTGMVFPPGVKRSVNIVAYPNEPGNHDFTFIPHHATTKQLRDESGSNIVIGGKVNVVR